MRTRLVLLGLWALGGCTSRLTLADAAPYQACARDQDCTLDTLDCSGSCGTPVAIAADKQQAFDQLRGCWPPKSSFDSAVCDRFCTSAICSAGRCTVAQGCPAIGSTTGFSNGSTTSGSSSGSASSSSASSSSGSGSTGSGSSSGSSSSGGTT